MSNLVVFDHYEDIGNDALNMYGNINGTDVIVSAWVGSLMCYPPEAYTTDADGNLHRDPAAVKRPRTEAEVFEMFELRAREQFSELFTGE